MQRIADGGGANAMDGRGELTLGPPAKPLGPFAATPKPGHAEGGATSKDDGTPMHLEGPQDAADEAPFKCPNPNPNPNPSPNQARRR